MTLYIGGGCAGNERGRWREESEGTGHARLGSGIKAHRREANLLRRTATKVTRRAQVRPLHNVMRRCGATVGGKKLTDKTKGESQPTNLAF